jgi:hypothetical protein
MSLRGWTAAAACAGVAALVAVLVLRERGPAAPGGVSEEEVGAWRRETAARLDALERRIEEMAERLAAAPAAPPAAPAPPASEPTLAPAPPRSPAPPAAAREPEGPRLGDLSGFAAWHKPVDPAARAAAAALAEKVAALGSLADDDRSAALAEARRMLGAGDEADRGAAVEFLAASSDATFLPAVREAIGDALRDGRRGDVHRLVNASARMKDRMWSAKQATGEPDTPIEGDIGTAWASKGPDEGEVWLELSYERAVRPDLVRVHESHHPGAVARVLAQAPDGSWEAVWEGREAPREAPWVSELALSPSRYATSTIRLVLDTNRVPGWNEVDAVELVGDGLRQWARSARASSTFGE